MENNTRIKKNTSWKRYLFGSFGMTIIITIYWLIDLYPNHPKTIKSWFVFVTIGVPAYLFLEWVATKMFNIDRFKNFSIVNLLIVVFILLVVTVIGVLLQK